MSEDCYDFFIIDGKFNKVPANICNHRGLLLGDGIFETIRIYKKKALFIERHYQRLEHSAKFLQMQLPFSLESFCLESAQLIEKSAIEDGVLRLGLSRIDKVRSLLPKEATSSYLLSVKALNIVQNSELSLGFAPFALNEESPLLGIKSSNYLERIVALMQRPEFDDLIFLNRKGNLLSTTKANLFFLREGTLLTPPLFDGVLNGISRSLILELVSELGIKFECRSAKKKEILSADEVFVSNALCGIARVSKIENKLLKSSLVFSRLKKHLKEVWEAYGFKT